MLSDYSQSKKLVKGCSLCFPDKKIVFEDSMSWAIELEPGHLILCPREHLEFNLVNLSISGFLLNVPGLMGLEKFGVVVDWKGESKDHLYFRCYLK